MKEFILNNWENIIYMLQLFVILLWFFGSLRLLTVLLKK